MEVKVTTKPEESKAELAIDLSAAEFKPFLEKGAQHISKEHPLKGFRPGKVPVPVIAEKFGTEHLLQHALEEAIPHFFVKAAVQEEVEAINRPAISVSKASIDGPVQFIATVETLPHVTLGDPKKIKLEKRSVEVTEEHLAKEIDYLARNRSNYLDVARPAQKGDVVTVDFDIMHMGATIEGGSSKNHPIPLGEGHFVPGFEEGIVGMAAGQEKTFPITFPTDYHKEDLKGKAVEAKVKAHRVQQRVQPAIDDAFAKSLGKFESLQHMKDALKKNMQDEKEEKERERHMGEVAEAFANLATFTTIPEILIEREIDHRLQEFAQMLAMQQRTVDDYLAAQKKTLEQVRADMREAAEKTVKVGLAMRQFAKENEITVVDKEIDEEAGKQLQYYKTASQASEQIDPQELREQVASQLRNRKTLEKLAELAQG